MGARTSYSNQDKNLAYYFVNGVLKFSIIRLNLRSMDLLYFEQINAKFLAWTSDLLLVDVV